MAFTLHGAPMSPFVRKVMYLLASSQTPYKLNNVIPGAIPEDFIKISPLKRIPVLQEEDWFQADSSIICNYLIETLNHKNLNPLIPSEPRLRAKMRWLEKFADYELAPCITFTVFRHRILKQALGKAHDEDKIQAALTQSMPKLFNYLSAELGDQHYFADDCFSLADIAITSQLVNLMHANEAINEQVWPNLHDYFQRMLGQPIWHQLVSREQITLAKIHQLRHKK